MSGKHALSAGEEQQEAAHTWLLSAGAWGGFLADSLT